MLAKLNRSKPAEPTFADLISRKRDKRTSRKRHEFIYQMVMAGKTYQAIGDILGGRTPATILHGFKKSLTNGGF